MKYNVNKTNPYISEPMWIQLTKSNFKFFLSRILGYRPVVNFVYSHYKFTLQVFYAL